MDKLLNNVSEEKLKEMASDAIGEKQSDRVCVGTTVASLELSLK